MIGTLCKEYTLLSEEEINKIREVSRLWLTFMKVMHL